MKCKKMHLICIPTLLSLLVSNTVLAEHLKLDDIEVISEENSPLNKDYATTAGDAAKLLENEMGVSLYRAGGVSSLPVIHGLADDRIRIQVDGMDLISSCANHMNPALSYIDPFNVQTIKVYSGITPVSVGGDSIAGTILMLSKQPEFAMEGGLLTHATINSFYKSNNDAHGVNLSASVANAHAYLQYTGTTVEANNYRAGGAFKAAGIAANGRGYLGADEVGSSYYHSDNHAFVLGFHQENHLFELMLGLQEIPYQGFTNQRMDMTNNESQQYRFKYEGHYDWGLLKASAYHQRTRHSMNFGDDKQFFYGTAPGMPMETEGVTTGVSVEAETSISSRDLLRMGAEYQRYRLDDWWPASGSGMMMGPNVFWNINNGKRDHFDVFAELDSQWNQQWFTQVGIRASQLNSDAGNVQGYNNTTVGMAGYGAAANAFNALDHSKSDHNVDVTMLARYTPDHNSSVEAGYAMKTRAPNLYERYTWANTNTMVLNMNNWIGDGNGYVGNINLKPETAHTLSITGEWHDAQKEDWQIKVEPYFTYITDYIDAVSCASVGKTCASRTDGFVNLSLDNQTAQLYGIDMRARKRLSDGQGLGRFTLTSALSYTRGRNLTTDDDLYQIMPFNLTLGVEHAYSAWKTRVETKLVDAKSHVEAIRKENMTAGYSLFNLYSSYDWKHARLDIGIENLFDRKYAYPLGGAYIGQGATMGTGVLHGVQVPGMGRSVNVGVTLLY